MRSFVTGATGFIGSAIVRKLLTRGHVVTVLARPDTDRANIEGLGVTIVEGELRDRHVLERCVARSDCVFHAAADYRLWVPDPAQMYATNVEATRALMELCIRHGVPRVVYTSSVAVLGACAGGRIANEDTEAQLDDMIGYYKRSKFLAEQAVRQLIRHDALPAIIVYPTAPVGPRDIKPTPTGRTILDAACGRMPAYVNTGLNIVHVDDVAEGHVLALERGNVGDRFILGSQNMTLEEILQEVAQITGRPAPRFRLPHKVVLPLAHLAQAWARVTGGSTRITVDAIRMSEKMMHFSSERAMRLLGYRPRPAANAIRDAVEWFRAHDYCGGAERNFKVVNSIER